jgi:hypothetical protein
MKLEITRETLFSLMVNGKIVVINGIRGSIQNIQLEDGSGYCFNVTLLTRDNGPKKVFVRCSKLEDSKIMA